MRPGRVERRYCRRCRRRTFHTVEPWRLPPWRWLLFAPLLWVMHQVLDPPTCRLCLLRQIRELRELDDDQGGG